MKHKITVEDGCIGCGACTTASTNFEMKDVDGDMKAVVKKTEIEESELNEHKEASDVCPVSVIKIEEIKE